MYRIDFIGFDREKELIGPIGFEVKDPARWSGRDGHFTNFTAAIKQCCDYSEMVVQSQFKDNDYDEFVGKRLRYVFLYCVHERGNDRGEIVGGVRAEGTR